MNRDSKTTRSWSIKHLKSPVDGIDIRYATRDVEDVKLRILFLNGRNEWIEKYGDIPGDTAFADAYWVTMDHRGQGASGGPKAHVNSYDDYVADVAAVVADTFGDKPYLIIAHSMGGLIATYGTMKDKLHPSSIILCSPLFGILTPMPLLAGKILAYVISATPFGARPTGAGTDRRANFEGNPLTHSQERFDAMAAGPYKPYTPTFRWVHESFKATAFIFNTKFLKRLKIPISIAYGSGELVVNKLVFELWLAKWKELNGQVGLLKCIEGADHELLNESDAYRDQALAFVNDRIRATT